LRAVQRLLGHTNIVSRWVASIGLDAKLFGTHSLRRTTRQYARLESTVRYFGIEALAIAEQTDV
jgi:hypothetical protein